MNSVLCESVEANDELFYINTNNKTTNSLFDYNNMEDLYGGSRCLDRLSECSSEEEEFDYTMLPLHAPPPSPQETPMLDMIFSSQLTSSLEQVISNSHHHSEEQQSICTSPTATAPREIYSDPMKHAQTLDKLLRRTHHQQQKSHHIRKNSSSCSSHHIVPIHTRSKSSDFAHHHKRSYSNSGSKPTSPIKEEFFASFKHNIDTTTAPSSDNKRLSWYARARKQKLENIAKAADIAEKLKKALEDHIVDEKTKTLITELLFLGL
jgi:hypothetical protein